MIQIKHRITGAVLFECELPEDFEGDDRAKQRYAVVKAVSAGANLSYADLSRANLSDANLSDANLSYADLSDANLSYADLSRAYLSYADLSRAYLSDANLSYADLSRAYLSDANLSYADLSRAYLSDANLSDANLSYADLSDANLSYADLSRAYLSYADLSYADLSDANLSYADLSRAYLSDANLSDANLSYADLSRADLSRAYLSDANLSYADLSDALNFPETNGSEAIRADTAPQDRPPRKTPAQRAAEFRARNPDVPVVEALDAKILSVVTSGRGKLKMSQWHTCETTHCRAGWAITLAGEAGAKLEAKVGLHQAGRMIYRASTGRVPHFFATDERAMEDIKRCAEKAYLA